MTSANRAPSGSGNGPRLWGPVCGNRPNSEPADGGLGEPAAARQGEGGDGQWAGGLFWGDTGPRGQSSGARGSDGSPRSRGPQAAHLHHVCDLPSSLELAPERHLSLPGPPKRAPQGRAPPPWQPSCLAANTQHFSRVASGGPCGQRGHILGARAWQRPPRALGGAPAGARSPRPRPRLDSLLAAPRHFPVRAGAHTVRHRQGVHSDRRQDTGPRGRENSGL